MYASFAAGSFMPYNIASSPDLCRLTTSDILLNLCCINDCISTMGVTHTSNHVSQPGGSSRSVELEPTPRTPIEDTFTPGFDEDVVSIVL
jgi:hypothetical protein